MPDLTRIARISVAGLCLLSTSACLPGLLTPRTPGLGGPVTVGPDRTDPERRPTGGGGGEEEEVERLNLNPVTFDTVTGVVDVDVPSMLETDTSISLGATVYSDRPGAPGDLSVSYDADTGLFTITGLGQTGTAEIDAPPMSGNPAGYGFFVSTPRIAPDGSEVVYVAVQEDPPPGGTFGVPYEFVSGFAGFLTPEEGMPTTGTATFTGGGEVRVLIQGGSVGGNGGTGDATLTADFGTGNMDLALRNLEDFGGNPSPDMDVRGITVDGRTFSGGTISGDTIDLLTGTVDLTVSGGFYGFDNDTQRPAEAAGQFLANGGNGYVKGQFIVK